MRSTQKHAQNYLHHKVRFVFDQELSSTQIAIQHCHHFFGKYCVIEKQQNNQQNYYFMINHENECMTFSRSIPERDMEKLRSYEL